MKKGRLNYPKQYLLKVSPHNSFEDLFSSSKPKEKDLLQQQQQTETNIPSIPILLSIDDEVLFGFVAIRYFRFWGRS